MPAKNHASPIFFFCSYDNVANALKPVLEKTVKAAVTEKVNAQKDITKEQRTELIRKKTIAASDEQASALAIFKNNATFLFTLYGNCESFWAVYLALPRALPPRTHRGGVLF